MTGGDFLTVDGIRLECRWFGDSGDETRPALLLLHEGLGCVAMWRDFPDALAAATDCPVFAWSRRGYGASDPAPLPRPVDYMQREGLEVVPKILDALGRRAVFLIGHSDGASIAAVHAGAYDDERVKGLVLMAPHFFIEDETHDSIAAALTAYRETDLRARLARYHGDNVDCAFYGWNTAWLDPDFRSWNIEDYAEKITVPVLTIQGEDDEYGTAAQVESIAARAKGPVETHLLPDCGHSPFRDRREEALALIASFVASHAKEN